MQKTRCFILLFFMLIAVCCLGGCDFLGDDDNKYYCRVFSWNGSTSGTNYICSNSTDKFVYNLKNDGRAIYNYNTGEPVVSLNEEDREVSMLTATDDYIYYADLYTIFGFSLEDKKLKYTNSEYEAIEGMKAYNDNAFIVVCVDYKKVIQNSTYSVVMMTGEHAVNLNEELIGQKPVKEQDEYLYYEYEGYSIVVDDSLDKEIPQIAYISKGEFEYSCLPYNTYIMYAGTLYRIDMCEEVFPKADHAYGGVNAAHVVEKDGVCTMMIQYSKLDYRCNPTAPKYKGSSLCKYNLLTREFELIYEAKKDEQIICLDKNGESVIIVKNEGIYRKNIKSGKNEKIYSVPKKQIEDGYTGATIFSFVWDGDMIYVYEDGLYVDTPEIVMTIDE